MGISGVLSYLEYAILHKIFVLGFRRNLMSEQAMAACSDMPPVPLTLSDYRITLDNGRWCSDCSLEYQPRAQEESGSGVEQEVLRLRKETRRMTRELEKFKRQSRELDNLKERWSNLDFKYQLLMDMWTLRTLDKENGSGSPRE